MKEEKSDWIFYLRLSRKLPKHYFELDQEFKSLGYSLIPVTISELVSVTRGEGSFHVVTAVTGMAEATHYTKKVQKVFGLLLRNKRLNLYISSSFKFIDQTSIFGKTGQYHYTQLPVSMKNFCGKITTTITNKENQVKKWPGGTRGLGATIGRI